MARVNVCVHLFLCSALVVLVSHSASLPYNAQRKPRGFASAKHAVIIGKYKHRYKLYSTIEQSKHEPVSTQVTQPSIRVNITVQYEYHDCHRKTTMTSSTNGLKVHSSTVNEIRWLGYSRRTSKRPRGLRQLC